MGMNILSAEHLRAWDAATLQKQGIASIDLMNRACMRMLPHLMEFVQPGQSVRVCCGRGNNGGDGMGLACLLKGLGHHIEVLLLPGEAPLSGDAAQQVNRLAALGVEVSLWHEACPAPAPGALVLDALFGAGLNRTLDGQAAAFVDAINIWGNPVVSIDLPSGLMADQTVLTPGQPVVRAQRILTLHAPKACMLLEECMAKQGSFIMVDIGLEAPDGFSDLRKWHFTTYSELRPFRKPLLPFAHKHRRGHCWLVGGSEGKAGAVVLAGSAALASGAGLITLGVGRDQLNIVQSALPQAMAQVMGLHNPETLPKSLSAHSLVVGMGLGRSTEAAGLVRQVIQDWQGPLVLDADALWHLAQQPTWLGFLRAETILTPHEGELDRLVGPSSTRAERLEKASGLSQKNNIIIILKGNNSAVCCPDGSISFNSSGNAALAKAGSGDLLSGILGAHLAMGYPPALSALLGVFLHGQAADYAIQSRRPEGVVAEHLLEALGQIAI